MAVVEALNKVETDIVADLGHLGRLNAFSNHDGTFALDASQNRREKATLSFRDLLKITNE